MPHSSPVAKYSRLMREYTLVEYRIISVRHILLTPVKFGDVSVEALHDDSQAILRIIVSSY